MIKTEAWEQFVDEFIEKLGFSTVAATTDGRSVSTTDFRKDVASALDWALD